MEQLNINGFKIYLMPDNRLKTAAITVYINLPLREETASENALLPAVLMRGCRKFPETRDLNIYMEQLFGANISSRVEKQGSQQRITLRFKTISDKFAEGSNPFVKVIYLLGEILFNPLIEDGGFRKSYTDREKEVQIQYIEGLMNDKRTYSNIRLIEEMCKNEEFSVSACGTKEQILKIDEKSLYKRYLEALKEANISIYVTDNFEENTVKSELKEILKDKNVQRSEMKYPEIVETPSLVKFVQDEENVTQGKLSMGFRTNIVRNSPDYYAMAVFNKIYGGSVYSKLFLNVREKLSLAYYASSSYNSLKGLVTVASGIEFENFEKAKDEILLQLDEMKKGNFEDSTIDSAKIDIKDSYKGISDFGEALSEFYSFLEIAGVFETPEDVVEKVNAVTRDDIIRVAKTVELDTVYFLSGKEEE